MSEKKKLGKRINRQNFCIFFLKWNKFNGQSKAKSSS